MDDDGPLLPLRNARREVHALYSDGRRRAAACQPRAVVRRSGADGQSGAEGRRGAGGWSGVAEHLRSLGGIATRAEILAGGWSEDMLRFARDHGSIVSLRHGWFGSTDLAIDVRRSWAAGGPLACVSALVHHGRIALDHPDHDSDVVHVALRRHGRPPVTLGHDAHDIGIVWHYVDTMPPGRRAVSVDRALRQLARCSLPRAGDARLQRPVRVDDSESLLDRLLAEVGPWKT